MTCGSSSVGRASASQAEGREFEPLLPLNVKTATIVVFTEFGSRLEGWKLRIVTKIVTKIKAHGPDFSAKQLRDQLAYCPPEELEITLRICFQGLVYSI